MEQLWDFQGGQCLTIDWWLRKIGAEPFQGCMDAILGVLESHHGPPTTDRRKMDALMGDDKAVEDKLIRAGAHDRLQAVCIAGLSCSSFHGPVRSIHRRGAWPNTLLHAAAGPQYV